MAVQLEAVSYVKTSFEKAYELFHDTRRSVTTLQVTERLWERMFDDQQRQRLGQSLREACNNHRSSVRMWMYLYSVSYQRAVIAVGEAMGFLTAVDANWLRREGGELPRSPEAAQSEAIGRGDLVIVRNSRSVFWEGNRIEGDWFKHSKSWEFLLIVCEHAKQNRAIDRCSFGADAAENIVSQRKCRLIRQVPGFPITLYDAFTLDGKGTQRFTVPADRIHFFKND